MFGCRAVPPPPPSPFPTMVTDARRFALELAFRSNPILTADEIVKVAETYFKFLKAE